MNEKMNRWPSKTRRTTRFILPFLFTATKNPIKRARGTQRMEKPSHARPDWMEALGRRHSLESRDRDVHLRHLGDAGRAEIEWLPSPDCSKSQRFMSCAVGGYALS